MNLQYARCFVQFLYSIIYIYISSVGFVVPTKSLYALIHTEYIYTGYVEQCIIYCINVCMYVCVATLEVAAPTVLICWL
jgi:hypothetical protein